MSMTFAPVTNRLISYYTGYPLSRNGYFTHKDTHSESQPARLQEYTTSRVFFSCTHHLPGYPIIAAHHLMSFSARFVLWLEEGDNADTGGTTLNLAKRP